MPSKKKTPAAQSRQNRAAHLKRKAECKRLMASMKAVPCADCGRSFPACCMDFDHVRGKKLCTVSSITSRGNRPSALLREAAKCDVICSNCHRIRTHILRDHRAITIGKPAAKASEREGWLAGWDVSS